MKSKTDIFHVYAGTGGVAGLYLDTIYQALAAQYNQKCFVSYYYPFNYGRNTFYRLTDMTGSNIFRRFQSLRYMIRLFELVWSLIYVLVNTLIYRPTIINYSGAGNLKVELYFLRMIKKFTATKICLTMHDVIPFATGYSSLSRDISAKQEFLNLADFILVHNANSAFDLQTVFSVGSKTVLSHPFPIMDATKIYNLIGQDRNDSDCLKFLFVGHVRKEKGVDLLIEAWNEACGDIDECSLTIAGNVPGHMVNRFGSIDCKDIVILDRFLSDREYIEIISEADFLILPYRRGTNSGIPSTALSLGTQVLCSDIELFANGGLINNRNLFRAGSVEDLQRLLVEVVSNPKRFKYSPLRDEVLLSEYTKRFRAGLSLAYKEMFN